MAVCFNMDFGSSAQANGVANSDSAEAAPVNKGLAKEPIRKMPPTKIPPLPPKKLFLMNCELCRKPER